MKKLIAGVALIATMGLTGAANAGTGTEWRKATVVCKQWNIAEDERFVVKEYTEDHIVFRCAPELGGGGHPNP